MKNGGAIQNNANLVILDKKAVKAALNQDWKSAIELNLQILEIKPNDRKANMRLGMAYLQTKNFKEAEKAFKQVLKVDPINTVAQKNLELAKSKKQVKPSNGSDTQQIIREPGTTTTTMIELSSKSLTADSFEPREPFSMKVNKASVTVSRKGKPIGKITMADLVKRLNKGKKERAELSVMFFGGKEKIIKLLLISSVAIFKAEKQDFKPYMQKDAIDEPEIEMAPTEEIE